MTRPPEGGQKYEHIRRLGTDGPFVVEVARPQEPGGAHQAVLLKRLRPGWPVSNQALSSYLDDARNVSRLAHPNIVRVLDITKDKQGPVVVTEYIQGVSLAAALRQIRAKNLSFPLSLALSVVRQACSGLTAVQASGQGGRGVIHGAISPEHLMITFEGVVKCKDFGIFRMYPTDQRDSLGGPNPVYLSIEQEQGLPPNIRSDLYSLGRVFQKLLSLGADELSGQLPGEVLQILSDLLETDPAKRPQSAAVLGLALLKLSRAYGSGEDNDRLGLGKFIRGLFGTGSPAKQPPETEKPTDAKDDPLIDPSAFWEAGAGGAEPDIEEETGGEEVSGEAVVVSVPVGRPKELFLPESERIVVTPKPAQKPQSSPAPPVPQEDFLKAGKPRKANFLIGGVAAGILLLVLILVWSLSGSENEAATTDASLAGPVLATPQEPKEDPSSVKEESPPPPPPAARTGTLKLNSDPPGALVYINDEKKGVTPLTVKDASVGTEVVIRIELEGHRPWTQTVVLDGDNQVREFTAGLPKEEVCEFGAGWIYVTSAPEGGTVEIDGKRLSGKTPMIINDVCAGVEHEIRLQASGYRTWRKMVKVSPQKVLNLNVELER